MTAENASRSATMPIGPGLREEGHGDACAGLLADQAEHDEPGRTERGTLLGGLCALALIGSILSAGRDRLGP